MPSPSQRAGRTMTYYDPYVSVEQGRPSFHAEDLYELNRRSQTISASGGPSVPPGLASLHRESSHSDHSYPEVLSPRKPSHRKRLTKTRPRPASLAVGNPRTLAAPTTFSSASSASSAPGSAQMLFHVPPSVNAFSPAYGGHVHRISSTDFAQERVSSYSLGQDDYSLPPSANDTAFLIDKDAKRWPDASASAALPPGKRPLSLTPRARAPQRKGMFERPPWGLIALHCMLCCVAWPTINYMSPLVRASLFWTRAYVGVLCSAFGIPIAFSLLELVRRWSEAAGASYASALMYTMLTPHVKHGRP